MTARIENVVQNVNDFDVSSLWS